MEEGVCASMRGSARLLWGNGIKLKSEGAVSQAKNLHGDGWREHNREEDMCGSPETRGSMLPLRDSRIIVTGIERARLA